MHSFEEHWPNIQNVIERLVHQEPISKFEWQDLFCDVYMICSWDENGSQKLLKALKSQFTELLESKIMPQLLSIRDDYELLKEYSNCWLNFHQHCYRFPMAFQQLDLATKTHILNSCSQTQKTNPIAIENIGSKIGRPMRKSSESTVRTLMLKLWHDIIMSKLDIRLQLIVIDLISDARRGQLVEPQLVISLKDTFLNLDSLHLSNYKTNYMERFETVLNKSRFPEMVAVYYESLLRNTPANRENGVERRLLECLPLVELVRDKESFIKYHKIFLTRRLLLNSTISLDLEENLLEKFRKISGMPFEDLNKIARMFKDLRASEDFKQKFLKSISCQDICTANNNNNNDMIRSLTSQVDSGLVLEDNQKKPAIKAETVDIRILNPSCWPTSVNETPIHLPDKIKSFVASVEKFYLSQYSDRKLTWSNRLSNGIITFNSDKGQFDLCVTAAQLSVLDVLDDFSGRRVLKTFVELEQQTKLAPSELKRAVWSLVSNPKLKVQPVLCIPTMSEIKELDRETNVFTINRNFVLTKCGQPQTKGRTSIIGKFQI